MTTSWATTYIEKLKAGETVSFRPRGNSMEPRVKSGQLCTVQPGRDPEPGDVVLCHVAGKDYLHLVKAVDKANSRYQIGNNKGHINGWTSRDKIYGILISVAK